MNKRNFIKASFAGLLALLVPAPPKQNKKFGYASVYKDIYHDGELVRHGDYRLVFEDKQYQKYIIQEANDEEGWFVTNAERDASGQCLIRYDAPRKFENVEFTIEVDKKWRA